MKPTKKTELVNHLEKQLIEVEIKIESLKRNINRVRQRVSYWKVKCSKLQSKSSEEKELEFNTCILLLGLLMLLNLCLKHGSLQFVRSEIKEKHQVLIA